MGGKNISAPAYTITEKAADYLAKIVEAATRLEYGTNFKLNIKLHRENRLRTIYSSLAIEGNSLSLDEVTDVIAGKWVAGTQTDIKEAKNAFAAYEHIMTFNPFVIRDFLKAHALMTHGLIKESGKFRSGDVGVFDNGKVIHLGARPRFVPQLMEELFGWAGASQLHPVLKSAILHYEIETIHPFADGNGRMGRLWQTLVVSKWNELFKYIPMETVLFENRPGYYRAIEESRKKNDSAAFIEFTLSALSKMTEHQLKHQDKHQAEHQDKHQDKHQVEWSDTQLLVLKNLEKKALSRKEIFAAIQKNNDSRAFKRIMEPLLTGGRVEMTVPEKPNSRYQKYRLAIKKGV